MAESPTTYQPDRELKSRIMVSSTDKEMAQHTEFDTASIAARQRRASVDAMAKNADAEYVWIVVIKHKVRTIADM